MRQVRSAQFWTLRGQTVPQSAMSHRRAVGQFANDAWKEQWEEVNDGQDCQALL